MEKTFTFHRRKRTSIVSEVLRVTLKGTRADAEEFCKTRNELEPFYEYTIRGES